MRSGFTLYLFVLTACLSGCAGNYAVVPAQPGERQQAGAPGVSWFTPELASDPVRHGRWRRGVGPPLIVGAPGGAPVADRLIIVNWNVNVGGGDIPRLFTDLVTIHGDRTPMIFLLQEAYRSGPDVPQSLEPGAIVASAIRRGPSESPREGVESLASSLGLHAYYVPSMRNGGPLVSDEDRGNAILATMPLGDLCAIELPFERQRRVAVGATVSGTTLTGTPWRLHVVSAHLDSVAGSRRLWFAGSEFARTRQARGLLTAMPADAPLVLGADLNTWFGFLDAAYRTTARAFPHMPVTDRRPTFGGLLRLDHMFFRLDDDWTATYRRAESSYGSDHYPLIGTIDFR